MIESKESLRSNNRLVQFCLSILLLFFSVVFTQDVAQAQSGICRQLSAELASLNSNRGTSREYRKFDNALREQSVQLNRTVRLAKRQRCNTGIFRNRSPQCARINGTIERMEDNLDYLRGQRDRHSPNNARTANERSNILAAMRRNRCLSSDNASERSASVERPRKSRRRTLLEQIFGVRTYGNQDGRLTFDDEFMPQDGYGGTYRTLCVRESDGYYFPISFSTRQNFFQRDEETCQAMCPGTKVGLYHHHMPGEDSEQMVEYGTEQPYSTKPFAFLYRKNLDANSTCRFATAEFSTTTDYNQTANKNNEVEKIRIGIPVFRKDPQITPDDYDNKTANFDAADALKYLENARNPKIAGIAVEQVSKKNIRIVGPAFFPVQ